MTSRFLVSFSNQAAYSGRPVLAVVDVATETFYLPYELIDNDHVMGSSGGAGLCRIPTGYVLLLQGFPCRLCYLRPDLSLERVVFLKKVEDAHSVVWTGHSLMVVSTETNAVVEVGLDDEEKVVYYEGTPNSKSEHLNGIALDSNGDIILSGFGNRRGCGQAPRDGFLKRISTGETLVHNLREPHSVQYYDGTLYTLESQTGNLVRSRDGRTISNFEKFFGYARGLAFNIDYTVVGQSALRFGSRKSVEGGNTKGQVRASEGALHVLSAAGRAFLPLGQVADEIYDVINLDSDEPLDNLAVIPADEFFSATGKSKNFGATYLYKSWRERNSGSQDASIESIIKALNIRPKSATFLTALGIVLNQQSRWAEAEAVLRQAQIFAPKDMQICSLLAESCLQAGKHDEAASLLTTAIKVAPRYKRLGHDLGEQYVKLGKLDDAEAVYRLMAENDPEGDSTQRLLAGVLYSQARYADALPHALRAVDLRSDVGEYYEFIAFIYRAMGDLASAEYFVREAIRFERDTETFRTTLLVVLLEAGLEDAAFSAATDACRQNPSNQDLHARLGERLLKNADSVKAVRWFEDVIKAFPQHHRLHHALSRLHRQMENLPDAIRIARQACEIAPWDPHCRILLGYHLLDAGSPSEAATAFQEAVKIDPNLAAQIPQFTA